MKKTTIILIAAACSLPAMAQKKSAASPHLIVYKTKKDYRNHVPVTLSADKSQIVNYPDPKDVANASKSMPTVLHKGYLMDNRGVGENTAFLTLTYQQYAKLNAVPPTDDLYNMIADKDPMATVYDCGNRYSYKDPVAALNQLIDENKLTEKCKVIKHGKRR